MRAMLPLPVIRAVRETKRETSTPRTELDVAKLGTAVFNRALVLAEVGGDFSETVLELSRLAQGDVDVLARARAHAAALLHAEPSNRGALGAVTLLSTAAKTLWPTR